MQIPPSHYSDRCCWVPFVAHTDVDKIVKCISLQYRAGSTNTSVPGDLTGYNDKVFVYYEGLDGVKWLVNNGPFL